MNKIINQTLITIMIGFIISMFLLSYHLHRRHKKMFDNSPSHEYMLDIQMTQYKEDGSIKSILTANTWVNYQKALYSDLENPRLIVFKDNGLTWDISSKQAVVINKHENGNANEIILTDKVKIIRPNTASAKEIKVTTDKLHYFPENEDVNTDKKVELQQPGLIINGTGLTGNLDTQFMRLHQNVSTEYTPPTS